jgi:cell division protein FtsW
MAKRVSVDKTLFTVTLLLVFVGLIMVFSASAVMAKERFGSPYSFVLRQFAWAFAGVIAMFFLMKVDYKRYRSQAIVFSLVGLTVLFLISVFFLDRSHNTHRWFRLGPMSFQPSELAKPAAIFYLAWFLEQRVKQMDDWRHTLLPAVGPPLLMAALIAMQPDLGTAIAIAMITLSILWVAGMNLKFFLYPAAAAPIVFYFLVWRVSWRHQRILAFMDPYSDPLGKGFHLIQSLISVSTGGITGMGLMEGKQKLFFLPEPHTDFIFAVIGEEFGLLGTLFVVTLFAIFLYRGVRAAVVTRDTFGRYLATGMVAMICIQAFFNISVVLALLPTKGIPLPFISYGGSSLFVMLASVGVLLNITQQAE